MADGAAVSAWRTIQEAISGGAAGGRANSGAAGADMGEKRVIVQVGHCGVSVGADGIVPALRERLGGVALTVAGCDGACFAAPTVLVQNAAGGWTRVERVDVAAGGVERIIAAMESADGGGGAGADGADTENSESARFLSAQSRIALDGCGAMDAEGAGDYLAGGGYSALAKALDMGAEGVIAEVKASGLRGRGGAYFPAGLKWEGARKVRAERRYMVVNCEEGEPGLFKDRHLMEGVPHRVVEGALIAAFAAGAEEIVFYVNAEANLSARRLARAIADAERAGFIGEDVLGGGFSVSAEIRRGAGGYVCGDETTLLNTVEGYRREPRVKPPFPTESGLWGMPTVINNAETLANVPFIIGRGADAFAAVGDGRNAGTKIINLSGAVRRAGLVEVPFGTTLREIALGFGGGAPAGRELAALAVGGPSSGLFPLSMLDTPIAPGFLHESGVMLGAGGVIAVGGELDAAGAALSLARYNADESCGKCAPCREGTPRMAESLARVARGAAADGEADDLARLARTVNAASLCGLGQAAGNPVLSWMRFFGEGR